MPKTETMNEKTNQEFETYNVKLNAKEILLISSLGANYISNIRGDLDIRNSSALDINLLIIDGTFKNMINKMLDLNKP